MNKSDSLQNQVKKARCFLTGSRQRNQFCMTPSSVTFLHVGTWLSRGVCSQDMRLQSLGLLLADKWMELNGVEVPPSAWAHVCFMTFGNVTWNCNSTVQQKWTLMMRAFWMQNDSWLSFHQRIKMTPSLVRSVIDSFFHGVWSFCARACTCHRHRPWQAWRALLWNWS